MKGNSYFVSAKVFLMCFLSCVNNSFKLLLQKEVVQYIIQGEQVGS